jgi:nicotinamide riboside transporter PnuC
MNSFALTLTVVSLAGNVLVNKQDWRGQLLWIFANAGWIYVDAKAGMYEQAFLFTTYLILAIWGMYKWKFNKSTRQATS